jgi:hypothetical protein
MSKDQKRRVSQLRQLHKELDDNFLDNRLKPRYIVIVSESFQLGDTTEKKPWEKEKADCIAVNVNRFIAKYDACVARLVNPAILAYPQTCE